MSSSASPRQHADVVKRRAKAAAGERQPDLAEKERHGRRRAAAHQRREDSEAGRFAPAPGRQAIGFALQPHDVGHLARWGFQAPVVQSLLRHPPHAGRGLLEAAEPEVRLAQRAAEPPPAFERRVRPRPAR